MSLLRVAEAQVGSGNLVNFLDHEGDDTDKVLENLHLVFSELDSFFILLKLEGDESGFKGFIRAVFTLDDLLGRWVSPFRFLETTVEFDVFGDGTGDKVADLVTHESSNGVAEVLGLVLVKVVEFLSQDVSSTFAPFGSEQGTDVVSLSLLQAVELS